MPAESEHAYIAKTPCGCVYAVSVDRADDVQRRIDLGRTLAEWVFEGAVIERVPLAGAGLRLGCEHEPRFGGLVNPPTLMDEDAAWDLSRYAADELVERISSDHTLEAPEAWWEEIDEAIRQGVTHALRQLPELPKEDDRQDTLPGLDAPSASTGDSTQSAVNAASDDRRSALERKEQ